MCPASFAPPVEPHRDCTDTQEIKFVGKESARIIQRVIDEEADLPSQPIPSTPEASQSHVDPEPPAASYAGEKRPAESIVGGGTAVGDGGGDSRKRIRARATVGLDGLLREGVIQPGQRLCMSARGAYAEATFETPGEIAYSGQRFRNPTTFAAAVLASQGVAGKVDGWAAVRCGSRSLRELRDELSSAKDAPGSSVEGPSESSSGREIGREGLQRGAQRTAWTEQVALDDDSDSSSRGATAVPDSSRAPPHVAAAAPAAAAAGAAHSAASRARGAGDWPADHAGGRQGRAGREYRPKRGSAPWALLVGLLRLEKGVGTDARAEVTKEELAAFAQAWATDPIISKGRPGGPGGFGGGPQYAYAGWSCMKKSLVEKHGFVQCGKAGRKNVYRLTPAGAAVARELNDTIDEGGSGAAADGGGGGTRAGSALRAGENSGGEAERAAPANVPMGPAESLAAGSDRLVSPRQMAPPRAFNDMLCSGDRPRPLNPDVEVEVVSILDSSSEDEATSSGVQDPRCSSSARGGAPGLQRGAGGGARKAACRYAPGCWRRSAAHWEAFAHPGQAGPIERPGTAAGPAGGEPRLSGPGMSEDDVGAVMSEDDVGAVTAGGADDARPLFSAGGAGHGAGGGGAARADWEVVLVVDKMEGALTDLLRHQRVPFYSQRLQSGDFLWVALPPGAGHPQQPGWEGRAAVLDWIVERKRVDDFVSSIKSKRFLSQREHMLATGITGRIYLVEGDPSTLAPGRAGPAGAAPTTTWEDRIRSASVESQVRRLSSSSRLAADKPTSIHAFLSVRLIHAFLYFRLMRRFLCYRLSLRRQVLHGFVPERTEGHRATAAWLCGMTRQLQRLVRQRCSARPDCPPARR